MWFQKLFTEICWKPLILIKRIDWYADIKYVYFALFILPQQSLMEQINLKLIETAQNIKLRCYLAFERFWQAFSCVTASSDGAGKRDGQ